MSYSGKFKDKNNNLHPVTSVLYGTCDTAAATAAKVVTCSDFDALMTGVTIRVKFANANTAASPTVNINSTGAKSVYRFGSTAPADGNSWNAGEVVELVYDGTSFFMTGADDLSVKQNATDNSLDTEDKTIVGAINENAGDIGSLKSDLTTLDNEVNGDATTYPYADVITIPDAVPSNLADCSVKIEPVQDLHGQSVPWVGGAGKQKLPLDLAILKTLNTSGTWVDNVYTLNNVVFTVNLDDGGNVTSINANGTASAKTIFYLGVFADFLTVNTEYTINSNIYQESDQGAILQVLKANDAGYVSLTGPYSFTYASEGNAQKLVIRVENAATANNNVFTPMIRLATETDATFAPYTNICPISGHTEVDVQRDGKNLFDEENANWKNNYYIDENGQEVESLQYKYTQTYIPVEGGSSYALSIDKTTTNNVSTFLSLYNKNKDIVGYSVVIDATSETKRVTGSITLDSNVAYVRINTYKNGAQNIQLELGQTATAFEPYAGKTYTIALGSTIYGGTVDFDSGVMTVDRAIAEYDGSEDEEWNQVSGENRYVVVKPDNAVPTFNSNNAIANQFGISTVSPSTTPDNMLYIATVNLGVRCDSIDTTEDWTTFLGTHPLDVCYTLDTPTTIQLTPQQIQLLKGTNTLYASTGDISVTANGVSGSIGQVQEQVNGLAEDVAEVQSGLANIVVTQNSNTAIAVNDSYEFNADITAKAITICVYRYGLADSITVLAGQVEYWNNNNELYFVTGAGTDHVILKMQYNGTTKKCTATVKEATVAGIADTAVVISVVTMY